MIMTKRLDTGSPWPLNNGGRGKFAVQDGGLRLTQPVRASMAAPTYFAPEQIAIHARDGSVVDGAFIDGGLTPFNDPALQLLMLATVEGHGFCWPTGKDRLLIVSVGAGQYKRQRSATAIVGEPAALQGLFALASLMDDCERVNHATLQWLTKCLTPWVIDRAVGDMKLDSQRGPQLATYARYNAILEQAWLKTELGVDLASDKLQQIRKMDEPSNMDDLVDLGRTRRGKAGQARPFAGDLRSGLLNELGKGRIDNHLPSQRRLFTAVVTFDLPRPRNPASLRATVNVTDRPGVEARVGGFVSEARSRPLPELRPR